jgi:hypothetical protein
MTTTGITTTLKHNSKSYDGNNETRVTRIEVESEKYNEEPICQDVTLDTAYSESIKASFDSMFQDTTPEDLTEILIIEKVA